MFTFTVPEVPPANDGGANASISVTTDPDTKQMSNLLALGRDRLKQLGKNLREKYRARLLIENPLTLDFADIEDEVNCFQVLLEKEDPLSTLMVSTR